MKISDMSAAQIQKLLREQGTSAKEEFVALLRDDPRAGVRKLFQQFSRQRALVTKERHRLQVMQLYETEARQKGFSIVAGVDEAGRGPLAGPVVAAAVVLPEGCSIPGIDDSKKLTPLKRERLYHEIQNGALNLAVGISSVEEIDRHNILQASLMAMRRAVLGLKQKPAYILVDAVHITGINIPQLPIIKGDGKSLSIAAASIIAKVTRDRMMQELDKHFPAYGFAQNKGYGTYEHIKALKCYGQCAIHRRTFIKNFITSEAGGNHW